MKGDEENGKEPILPEALIDELVNVLTTNDGIIIDIRKYLAEYAPAYNAITARGSVDNLEQLKYISKKERDIVSIALKYVRSN
jgi:hypothetical protein